ncbi:MAG TPA: fumarylacetoacetate hydrolase family protein [Longimicrobiaceae bacterium]
MKVYRTSAGTVAELDGAHYALERIAWSGLLSSPDPLAAVRKAVAAMPEGAERAQPTRQELLAPVDRQEVWAAGVTYLRSRTARMEESRMAGGGTFYDRVYEAERPELFFKANASRVVGPGREVRIRADASWNVPEPELALVVNAQGRIVGYTIGNDMSSRDIEGENPLYLPQAKCYDGSCALGPGVLLAEGPLPGHTEITLEVKRGGGEAFRGTTTLSQMKRSPDELVAYLFREMTFPNGAILMTGTGVIPPDSFTLLSGDEILITISPIGTLVNRVA